MGHLALELALWLLLSFLIGCILGCLIGRWRLGRRQSAYRQRPSESAPLPVPGEIAVRCGVAAPRTAEAPAPEPAVAEQPALAQALASQAQAAAASAEPASPRRPAAAARMTRLQGLEQPRGGAADALQRITGIGHRNERSLHKLGCFHFDQIAAWTDSQVAWVDDHLRFHGRIKREEWVAQARLLAEGREEEFAQRYGRKRPQKR